MSGEVLTPPYPGFFGKLPVTGDFVTRGLPDAFRKSWDVWITRHVAPRLRMGTRWPQGGLRVRLVSGSRVAAMVIVPGVDSAGRVFPLSLCLIGKTLPGPPDLCAWFSGARRCAEMALARRLGADALQDALEALPPPEGEDGNGRAMVIWTRRYPPEEVEADNPGEVLDRMLSA